MIRAHATSFNDAQQYYNQITQADKYVARSILYAAVKSGTWAQVMQQTEQVLQQLGNVVQVRTLEPVINHVLKNHLKQEGHELLQLVSQYADKNEQFKSIAAAIKQLW